MYQIMLVSPDGQDYQLDCKSSESVEQAWERCDDLGSKWFFYPICFVVVDHGELTDRQRIISAPPMLEHLTGLNVVAARAAIAIDPDYITACLA